MSNLFNTVIGADFSRNAEGRVRDYLLSRVNYSPRDRPVLDSRDSIHISVVLRPYSMLDLNERDELITTSSWLTMGWRDESLTWDPKDFNNTDLVVMYTDEIWIPSVVLTNSLDRDGSAIASSLRGIVLVTSDGDALLGETLVQSTHCPISVRYFPLDSQVCPFHFVPGNQLDEHLIITTDVASDLQHLRTSEWDLVGVSYHNGYGETPNYVTNRPWSNFTFSTTCLHLQRHPMYYISTLIVPSTLLCILSMVTFLAPPDCGERISLSVSMVLGLTVFQLLVADTLPTASKEGSLLSSYLNANFILTCLVVPLSVTNINIANGDTTIVKKLMNNIFLQNLFLEYFPRILKVPSLRERIKSEREDDKAGNEPCGNNDVGKSKSVTDERGDVPFDNSALRETLTTSEKRRLQTRTFSVVVDRLVLIVFLAVFVVIAVVTVYRYSMNPGMNLNSCKEFIEG
ncbi:Acetylcholine receptor subunit alpha-like 2 [Holothuria leucospilota]|uniref:Acetylcholine receptor subunit alpha-like 2 n=1 Tax=Holothuria leucospilota TaxID=206669 RepID=A0A9Q1BT95_HOLLE|nr:Acetylcholine receptor subunit alpha-like 2 [Holothuria leucospilota]